MATDLPLPGDKGLSSRNKVIVLGFSVLSLSGIYRDGEQEPLVLLPYDNQLLPIPHIVFRNVNPIENGAWMSILLKFNEEEGATDVDVNEVT